MIKFTFGLKNPPLQPDRNYERISRAVDAAAREIKTNITAILLPSTQRSAARRDRKSGKPHTFSTFKIRKIDQFLATVESDYIVADILEKGSRDHRVPKTGYSKLAFPRPSNWEDPIPYFDPVKNETKGGKRKAKKQRKDGATVFRAQVYVSGVKPMRYMEKAAEKSRAKIEEIFAVAIEEQLYTDLKRSDPTARRGSPARRTPGMIRMDTFTVRGRSTTRGRSKGGQFVSTKNL